MTLKKPINVISCPSSSGEELKGQVKRTLFLALCWTPEVTETRTAETWASLWVCEYTLWVQWEDSSSGLNHTLLPRVSQLHICKIITILFFPLSFIHVVCLDWGSTAGMISYSVFIYCQWNSAWQDPLGISVLWITTGTTMHCCLSFEMSLSLLQEPEPM